LYDGPSKNVNLVIPGINGKKKCLQMFGLRNVWLKMADYHQGES